MKRRHFLGFAGGVLTSETNACKVREALGTAQGLHDGLHLHRQIPFDPSIIDARLDSRSISTENPEGARGAGGKSASGRKGRPSRVMHPGERVVLARIDGAGTIRHIWAALTNLAPDVARALRFEVFYDGLSEPSISVPVLEFFGLAHGRAGEYYSAMVSVNEGRGLNSFIPMPFRVSIRMELTNESKRHVMLYYQIDYTLERAMAEGVGYLHATFRRENPTRIRRDFVITEGLKGPGRYLGCAVGVRIMEDGWYGEGEVKIFRDGDVEHPTYCGTGLEDYVGSAWGLGRHHGPYAGAPIVISVPGVSADAKPVTRLVGFYRWHIQDPIMFSNDLRVTIQQIGIAQFRKGEEDRYREFRRTRLQAGHGWLEKVDADTIALGLYERADDYSAVAFIYCKEPQAVHRLDVGLAVQDIGWQVNERTAEQLDDEARSEEIYIRIRNAWDAIANI